MNYEIYEASKIVSEKISEDGSKIQNHIENKGQLIKFIKSLNTDFDQSRRTRVSA